jgi:hypothetical protein
MLRSQIVVTTGASGSGKTYRRCSHYLVTDFLVNRSGIHISNFPVKRQAMQDYYDEKNIDIDVFERVRLIPEDVLTSWVKLESGPWDYFKDFDLSGCHLALDEAHNYVSVHHPKRNRMNWQMWLGELRHRGATIEFLTQNESKLAREVLQECEIRYEILNGENRVDPVLKIRMSDWYELRAAFTGKYIAPCYELEYQQRKGRWVVQHEVRFLRDPVFFAFYDSFSAPIQGGVAGETEKREFEKRSKFGVLFWFVRRNFGVLLYPFLIVALFVWLLFFGGVKVIVEKFVSVFDRTSKQAGGLVVEEKVTPRPVLDVADVPNVPVVAPAVVPVVADVPNVPVVAPAVVPDVEAVGSVVAPVSADVPLLVDPPDLLYGKIILMTKELVKFENGKILRIGDKLEGFDEYEECDIEKFEVRSRNIIISGGVVVSEFELQRK